MLAAATNGWDAVIVVALFALLGFIWWLVIVGLGRK